MHPETLWLRWDRDMVGVERPLMRRRVRCTDCLLGSVDRPWACET
jgi:hypothetical protein